MMADEYIRREDFIQHLEKRKKGAAVTNLVWATIMAIERDVRDMPAADVAPVVRCKGCNHYDMGVCLKIYSDGSVHPAAWQSRKPEDFCSYGERKDNDEH